MRILILSAGRTFYGIIAQGVLSTLDDNLTVCSDGTPERDVIETMAKVGIDERRLKPSSLNWRDEDWDYQILISSEDRYVFPEINGKTKYRIVLPIKVSLSDSIERIRDIVSLKIKEFYDNSLTNQYDYSKYKCSCGK